MTRVLVTGGRAPAALELCRSLAAAGATVFSADSRWGSLCAASRAVTRSFRVPPARTAGVEYPRELARLAREHGLDWILPTCEEVFHAARGAGELPEGTRLFAADFDLLTRLHSKLEFIDLARAAGLPVPATERVTSARALDLAVGERGPQLVLKPEFSRFGSSTILRPRAPVRVEVSAARPWVAQEALDGPTLATFSVAHAGRLVAHAAYPIEHTAGPGAAVHFRAVQADEVLEQVRALVGATGYTGLMGLDFIVTDRGPVAIECNPRATSGAHLFAQDGCLGRAILEPGEGLLEPEADARAMVGLPMLLCLLRARSMADVRAWYRDLRSARPVLERFSDPGPALMQVPALVGFGLTALRHRTGLLEATTWDMEWNGEA